MERVTQAWMKSARETRKRLGEETSNAYLSSIPADMVDKPTVKIGDFVKRFFSGLQEGQTFGPEVLRGTEVGRGLVGSEKEVLKSFLDRFAAGANDAKAIAKQLGYKSVEELKGQAPKLYKQAFSSGEIT